VFVCSTEDLANRGDAEVAFLMQVIEQMVADKLSHDPTWQVRLAGDLDILPDTTARALKNAVEISRGCVTGAPARSIGRTAWVVMDQQDRALARERSRTAAAGHRLIMPCSQNDLIRPVPTCGCAAKTRTLADAATGLVPACSGSLFEYTIAASPQRAAVQRRRSPEATVISPDPFTIPATVGHRRPPAEAP
jgi:Putative undecaprenyl diphosphate synthase